MQYVFQNILFYHFKLFTKLLLSHKPLVHFSYASILYFPFKAFYDNIKQYIIKELVLKLFKVSAHKSFLNSLPIILSMCLDSSFLMYSFSPFFPREWPYFNADTLINYILSKIDATDASNFTNFWLSRKNIFTKVLLY